MFFEEQLAALGGEDLLNFLLKDDIPCPEILGEEDVLLEDTSLSEPVILDKEMDDLIISMLSQSEDEPDMLHSCLLADSDSGISEDQHLSCSPGNYFAGSPQSSDIVQADHYYSLHQDIPALEGVRSDVAGEDASIEFETGVDLEGSSMALEQSPCFPMAVAVDAGAPVQFCFPELVLIEKMRQLLEEEGPVIPTCLQLTKAEKQLRKKVHWMQLAQGSCCREIYMGTLENRSLLEQLQELQALVTQPATRTTTAKSYALASGCSPTVCKGVSAALVMVLSFDLVLSSRFCSFQQRRREEETELRAQSQQICKFPNQIAPDVQEDTEMQWFSPDPEDTWLLVSLSQSQEEEQSPPSPDHRITEN